MSLLLPELLPMIFFIYAEDNSELFNLRWTRILLVCRHWYDVAVRSPELWSHIELRDVPPGSDVLELDAQDIRRMNLQRSRAGRWPLTMNLTLFSTISEPKQTHLTTFWDPSTSFSLTIHGSNKFLQTIIHILEDRCHDILAHLVIGGPRGRGAQALILPDIILSDHTPRLRNLSVDHMLLSWASIKGLRSLRVVYKAWTRISFNLSEILDALVRCPLLEHLQIAFPGSFRPEAVVRPSDLTLSRIKSTHLLGPDEACGHLLHTLPGLHCTTKVSISAIDNSNRTGSSLLPSSFSYLSNHTSHIDAPVIRVVGFMVFLDSDHGRSKQFGLTGDVDLHLPIPDRKWSATGKPDATSYVGAIATPNKSSEINLLHHIIRQWPVTQVTHLDARFPSALVDQILWRALFASLPAVTTVLVQPETSTMNTLFDFLGAHLQETGQRVVNHIIKTVIQLRAANNAAPSQLYQLGTQRGYEGLDGRWRRWMDPVSRPMPEEHNDTPTASPRPASPIHSVPQRPGRRGRHSIPPAWSRQHTPAARP
ncbi:hypothetical protein PENSPDRAFT_760228 [Peniophora sp. CONT]|nr:hypothetical protein PENSPDRAFT_760228 [Peniophora sp. CONT]